MTELAGRRQVFGFCGVRPAHQPHESGVLSCQGVPPEEMTGRRQTPQRGYPTRLGSRYFPDVPGCAVCIAPVREVRFALGVEVEHYDPDASGRDSTWRYCRRTVAAMPPAEWSGATDHASPGRTS